MSSKNKTKYVSRSKYYNSKTKLYTCECERSFEKGQSLNAHFKYCEIHRNIVYPGKNKYIPFDGKQGWAKGLTKETDPRIARANKTRKKNLELEITQPSWTGKKLSKEHKDKISKGRIKYLENNSNSTEWFSISNGEKEIKVQGKWELTVAKWLNLKGIKWDRKRLNFKTHRRYTPDFYLVDTNQYIEVKGYMKDQDVYKMRTVLEEHDIDILIVENKEIKKLENLSISDLEKFAERYKNFKINESFLKIKY